MPIILDKSVLEEHLKYDGYNLRIKYTEFLHDEPIHDFMEVETYYDKKDFYIRQTYSLSPNGNFPVTPDKHKIVFDAQFVMLQLIKLYESNRKDKP
jgi:hypothetical protein